MSAVAAQFKGFMLYNNNRQTDGANRAHPPDVESDTLQCLCCLSAICRYTIHTLTSRRHAYTYRHETVELIGNLCFIMQRLVPCCSSFLSLFLHFFLSYSLTHFPLTISQSTNLISKSGFSLNLHSFLHLRHQFYAFHKTAEKPVKSF